MNRCMNMVTVLTVAGVLAGSATAFAAGNREANPNLTQPHPPKAQVAKAKGAGIVAKLKELTLSGIVARNETKIAGKNRAIFVLITDAGAKIHLPVAKAGKSAATTPAIKLADYIGQSVKVVAMGSEQKRGDKTMVRIKTLKTIEKATIPPADVVPVKAA